MVAPTHQSKEVETENWGSIRRGGVVWSGAGTLVVARAGDEFQTWGHLWSYPLPTTLAPTDVDGLFLA